MHNEWQNLAEAHSIKVFWIGWDQMRTNKIGGKEFICDLHEFDCYDSRVLVLSMALASKIRPFIYTYMRDKWFLVLHNDEFQSSVSLQCWEMIENANEYLCLLKQIQHDN